MDLHVKRLPKYVKNDWFEGQYGLKTADGRWLVAEFSGEPLAYKDTMNATKKRQLFERDTEEQLKRAGIILLEEADLTIRDHPKPQELAFPENGDWLRECQVFRLHEDSREELTVEFELFFTLQYPLWLIFRDGLPYCVVVRCSEENADYKLVSPNAVIYVCHCWQHMEIVEFKSRDEASAFIAGASYQLKLEEEQKG